MIWLIHCVVLILLILFGLKFLSSQRNKWIFLLGLVFKVISGLLVGYVYWIILQSGDTIGYFNHAINLIDKGNGSFWSTINSIFFSELPLNEWQSRTDFFSRFISPFVWISGGNYWLASIYFSLFSFFNSWLLVRALISIYPTYKFIIYLALLFVPSIVFWSSGLLKDSLVFLSVCAILAVFLHLHHFKKINYSFLGYGIICLMVLVKTKFFVAVILIGCILFVIIEVKFQYQKWLRFFTYLIIIFGSVALLKFLHPWMRLSRLPLTIFEINSQISVNSNQDNLISGLNILPSYLSLIFHTPIALFSGLFRPLPFESMTLWSIYFKFENLLILLFTCLTLWNYKEIRLTPWIKGALFFILVLAVFISLTTPNFGTLIRYRSVYMSFYIILISVIPYHIYFQKQDRFV